MEWVARLGGGTLNIEIPALTAPTNGSADASGIFCPLIFDSPSIYSFTTFYLSAFLYFHEIGLQVPASKAGADFFGF
jgi:hypothetical protein